MSPGRPLILRVGEQSQAEIILQTVQVLVGGGVVVVPTDTVYGVATLPGHERRLYEVKGRAGGKPIPILATDTVAVREVATFCSCAEKLAAAFWPGPLTMVLPSGAAHEGYRVPEMDLTRALLARAGGTLRVTSANRSGEADALTAGDAVNALGSRVDLVIDAGPSAGGRPSTVLKVEYDQIEVLREGAIAESRWRNVL